jgi:DNA-binding MarR family transcriptional regulator
MVARQTYPMDRLVEIVLPKGSGEKQLRAYNMCDGTNAQGTIAKVLKLDPGSLSRTITRWIEAGVVLRIGEGREARLLHVYPLPTNASKQRSNLGDR